MDEKGLVEVIVKKLVDNPDSVRISQVGGERSTILELHVDTSDIGKVIGKNGRIVTAIRTLLHAMAKKTDKRIILEVIE